VSGRIRASLSRGRNLFFVALGALQLSYHLAHQIDGAQITDHPQRDVTFGFIRDHFGSDSDQFAFAVDGGAAAVTV
jgi:hypothetical protein